jgi:uncharacterized protein
MSSSKNQIIGVISDTHGLLRPEVLQAFNGVSLILHAGDIGSAEVLDGLRALAPVVAVRGNNDTDAWAKRIPEVEVVRAGGISIYMLHNVKDMKLNPSPRKVHVVISGHSHKPHIEQRERILFLNPGSAGPRRFKLPVSVARLIIRNSDVRAELIELPLGKSK